MRDLIEALTILAKYMPEDQQWPTNCSHDILVVCHINEGVVSEEDVKRLDELGFNWDESEDYWYSFRFGSC